MVCMPSKLLHKLPEVIPKNLAYIFSQFLIASKSISSFKTVNVAPVFKQGNCILYTDYSL